MLHSIATVSLSGTLREKLEAVAAARFDGIEIFENDLIYFDGSPGRRPRSWRRTSASSIALFQPFRDFEACPRDAAQRNLRPRRAQVRPDGGARRDLMLVCTNVAPGHDRRRRRRRSSDLPRSPSARPARHPHRLRGAGLGPARAHLWPGLAIVAAAGHPRLGLILDSFHTLSLGDDPSGIAAIPGERIFFVQMADAPLLEMDVLQWSRHFRCFPGQGEFDVAGFLPRCCRAATAGRSRWRSSTTSSAPPDPADRRSTRDALAALPRGARRGERHGDGRALRQALARPVRRSFDPPPPALRRASTSSSSPSTTGRRPLGACSSSWASRRPAGTARRT